MLKTKWKAEYAQKSNLKIHKTEYKPKHCQKFPGKPKNIKLKQKKYPSITQKYPKERKWKSKISLKLEIKMPKKRKLKLKKLQKISQKYAKKEMETEKITKNRTKMCKIGSGDPRMALNRPCKHRKLNKNQNNCLKFEGKLKIMPANRTKIHKKTNRNQRKRLKLAIKLQKKIN